MKINQDKIQKLIDEIDLIISRVQDDEAKNKKRLSGISPEYQKSARNLVYYRAFRSFDLRSIQKKLGNLGLSRLARAEQHVMASLLNTRLILLKMIKVEPTDEIKSGLSIKRSEKLLNKHTKALLGYRSKGRRVRIMVTLPSEAAQDPMITQELVNAGMNCVRINCAHDGPDEWAKMITYVKQAEAKAKRKITVCMDLGGPKIRTGQIAPGPRVIKIRPRRNQIGEVLSPAIIPFSPGSDFSGEAIPVDDAWFEKLHVGAEVIFTSARGRNRYVHIAEIDETRRIAYGHSQNTCYIVTGTQLKLLVKDSHELTCEVGTLPAIPQSLFLKPGDVLRINQSSELGGPAVFDENGMVKSCAHISCTYPELFGKVKAGEQVFFDDGKIGGEIIETTEYRFDVLIRRTASGGSRLRADKGINFPDTPLLHEGLTLKDKQDLNFVAANADVVNYSFVNNSQDVNDLLAELDKLGVLGKLGIILKIETMQAFENLLDIIITAMKTKFIGVMIARGDLAVETGWDNIGRIQNEILSVCAAGHIPVVWATQVLENLTKKGLPSRSEITDAVMSLKAECVMLNKGPYINQAVRLLHKILGSMEDFQHKNEPMLPEIEWADESFGSTSTSTV